MDAAGSRFTVSITTRATQNLSTPLAKFSAVRKLVENWKRRAFTPRLNATSGTRLGHIVDRRANFE
jgi:hypothetical protein